MDKQYNVDDILSEIKSRKSMARAGKAPAAPPAPEPEDFPIPSSRRQESPVKAFPFPMDEQEELPHPNPLTSGRRSKSITEKARLRREEGTTIPKGPSAGGFQFNLEEPEEDVQIFSGKNEQRPIMSGFDPDVEEDFGYGQTRVLPKLEKTAPLDPEEFPIEEEPHYRDEYEDEYLEDEPGGKVDYSEYNSPGDRIDVARDIANVKLWLVLRAAITLLLTGILVYLAFSLNNQKLPLPVFMFPEENMKVFLLVNVVLTAALALVNSSAMGGGLINLFRGRANSDALPAFAVLAAVAQGVVLVANPEQMTTTGVSLLFCSSAMSMLFNALGKMSMINRIQRNFRIIGSERPKRTAALVESESFSAEYVRDSVRRHPTVVYSAPATFFTDFLALSYSDKYDVGIYKAVAPVCLGGALVVAVVTYFLTKSLVMATTALAAVLCVSAAFSSTFIENIPLGKLTKRLAPEGGMVSGTKAVEDFCDTKAVVLTDTDLFPDGYVKLHGIKSFAEGRVDQAIIDAASVACACQGALHPVFMQMIGGDKKLLRPVDNIVCENGMGLSAWVDSKRVLIGNRELMKNHGVKAPSLDYEQKYTVGENEVVYLACSGEISAMFVVSYHCVQDLAEQMDLLAGKGTKIVLHTTDANINPQKIWEVYGYPQEDVLLMSGDRYREFDEMRAPKEKVMAKLAYTGRASVLLKAIIACINARSSILAATVLQLAQIVVGYGAISFLAFVGSISSVSFSLLIGYQLIWFLVIFLFQQLKQA
ncbi:hypothetical protein U6B65_10465 [Oscillospiraceae bacterium MB08-C2-2]|nr:hypothetical protein U6B65_10465 [Oscillospiraceae bacterium MB08-C2-2]